MTSLDTLAGIVESIRDIDPEMPAQTLAGLLFIARKPGCSVQDMQEYLQVGSGTGTRIACRLGEWERYEVPGLKLVRAERDPKDRRKVMLWLTAQGQKAVKKLTDHLQ